jgi:hypothetical protein
MSRGAGAIEPAIERLLRDAAPAATRGTPRSVRSDATAEYANFGFGALVLIV